MKYGIALLAFTLGSACGDAVMDTMLPSTSTSTSTETTAANSSSTGGESSTSSGSESGSSSDSGSTGWLDPVPQDPRRMFVSGGVYLGTEIGGYLGGIDICNSEASQASLPGHYQPWLGGDHMTPALWGAQDYTFTNEYRLPSDEVVTADGWLGLTSGSLNTPIYRNARGETVSEPFLAWTNVDPEGFTSALESSCADWGAGLVESATSGVVGDIASVTVTWAYLGPRTCAGGARLYCVETTIPWWETADHP